MDDTTASESEHEMITRSVLTRRRSITNNNNNNNNSSSTFLSPSSAAAFYSKSPYNASLDSIFSHTSPSTSVPQLGLEKPLLSDLKAQRQTRLRQLVEMGLILIPVVLATKKIDVFNNKGIQLWLSTVTLTLLIRYKAFAFPQTVYLLTFPPLISLATGYHELLEINLVLSLTSLPLPFNLVQTITPLIINQHYFYLPQVHAYLCQIIEWTCSASLTYVEVSLFASVLINAFITTTSQSYIQLATIIPLLSLGIASPYIEKLTNLTKIMGHHRRPPNSELLKQQYAFNGVLIFSTACFGFLLFICGKEGTNEMIKYTLYSPIHLSLLAYWISILLISLPLIMKHSASWQLDVRRKVWHGMIVLMFLPTINIDSYFVSMAMCVAIILFVLVEVIRATAMPPFGSIIHQTLLPYTDSRDLCGPIIVSHLFLILGISLPVCLCKKFASPAGIICLGLGDASASLIGRRFGKQRGWWIGSPKTIEGTLSFTVMSTVGLLIYTTFINKLYISLSLTDLLLVGSSTALLEATSGMNDNIIVPLYMLCILELL